MAGSPIFLIRGVLARGDRTWSGCCDLGFRPAWVGGFVEVVGVQEWQQGAGGAVVDWNVAGRV